MAQVQVARAGPLILGLQTTPHAPFNLSSNPSSNGGSSNSETSLLGGQAVTPPRFLSLCYSLSKGRFQAAL